MRTLTADLLQLSSSHVPVITTTAAIATIITCTPTMDQIIVYIPSNPYNNTVRYLLLLYFV